MAELNVPEMMSKIPQHFNPGKAVDVKGVVQCHFSGNQASEWIIRIEDQTCDVEEGTVTDPDLTIKANAQDGVKLLTGELDAMRAYMMGKIKVFGDLGLGMKLVNLFDR
jgi:putative sterol carrier protein